MSNTVQIVIVAKDQASKPVHNIAASFGSLAQAALKAAGIVTVGAAMAGLVKTAIGVNAALEQNKVAFTNFLGSGEKATAMLNELKRVAAETPFEFPQLVSATQRLLAYGFAADKVIPLMKSIGNVASGMGQGAEGINRITLALGQMQAKGVVRGQELLQLAEAGVKVGDVYEIMAQKTGKSVQEIMAAQEKGEIAATDFIAAFQEFADLKFGGMMEQQARTFTGAMSTIKDNIVNTLIAGGLEPLFKRLSAGVQAFANFTKTEEFDTWAKRVAGGVETVMQWFEKIATFVRKNATPILATLAALLAVTVVPALVGLAAAALPVVAPLLAIGAAVYTLVENWRRFEKTPLGQAIVQGVQQLGDALNPVIVKAREFLGLADEVKKVDTGFYGPTRPMDTAFFVPNAEEMAQRAKDAIANIKATVLNEIDDPAMYGVMENTGTRWVNNIMAGMQEEKAALAEKAKQVAQAAARGAVQAFTGGMSNIKTALEDLAKPTGKQPFGDLDFEDQNIKLEKLRASLPQLEEQLRRIQGTSTAKDLNWKFPDPNKIRELQAEIRDTNREIALAEGKMGDMSAANADWGNSGVKAAQRVRDAFKDAVNDMITSWQLSGQISDEYAEGWRKALGIVQTDEQKAMLNMTRIMGAVEEEGPETQRSVTGALSGIMTRFDGDTKKMANALAEYWKSATTEASKYGSVVAALSSVSVAPVGATSSNPLANPTAHSEGESAGSGQVWHWNGKLWVKVDAGSGAQGPAMGGAFGASAPAAAASAAGAEQVVGSIQHILDLFAGLSVDPRLRDMADAVNSVVTAFRTGMDALAGLKDYTAPARSAIDQAFADVMYLAGRLIDAGNRFDRALQWEAIRNFGDTASSLLGAFKSGVEGLVSLKDYTSPARATIDRVVADLIDISSQLIAVAGRWDIEAMAAAKQLAETMGAIGSALSSSVTGMVAAAQFPQLRGAHPFAAFGDALERWIRGFIYLSEKYGIKDDKDNTIATAAKSLAETVGAIGNAIGAIAEPMKKAAQFPVLVGEHPFQNIATAIQRWVQGLAWMNDPAVIGYDPKRAAELATIIKAIGDGLGSVQQALKDALEFPEIPAIAPFENLGVALREIITTMGAWEVEFGDAAARVQGFATLLGAVLSPMETVNNVVKGMIDIAEKVADGQNSLARVGEYLTTATRLAVNLLTAWADKYSAIYIYIQPGLEDYAKSLSTLLSPMSTITSITSAMIDIGQKIADGQANLANVGTYLNTATRMAVAMLTSWADEASSFYIYLAPKLEDYAARLSAVLSPFSTVTSSTSSMIDFAEKTADGTANLGGAFALMNTVTRQLVAQMQEWERTLDLGGMTTGGESVVAQYADKLGKIIGPFQSIAQVMTSVHEYARATLYPSRNLSQAITELGGYIEQIVTETAAMAARIGETTMKSAGNAATLLAPVAGFMEGMLGVFTRLATWKRPAGFASAIAALGADVNLLVSGIAAITLTDDNKAVLKTLGESLLPVVQSVSEMMNIFERVKFYAPLDAQKLTRLFMDIETFVTQAMETTNWHNLGEAATRSLIDGMVVGLTASDKRADLEAAMESLNALLGGDIGAGVEHIYNVTQNNTFNWNNPSFDVTTDERIREIAQQVAEDVLAALGYQATMNRSTFVPQV